jgi:hypothetical protein
MLVIPVLGRLRQEDCEFEASLGYTVRPSLKKKKKRASETLSFYLYTYIREREKREREIRIRS